MTLNLSEDDVLGQDAIGVHTFPYISNFLPLYIHILQILQ